MKKKLEFEPVSAADWHSMLARAQRELISQHLTLVSIKDPNAVLLVEQNKLNAVRTLAAWGETP